jgi:hypothetical protein
MSKQLKKARYEKRLRIAVRFDGEKLVLLDGRPLPDLCTGAVGELVLRPEAIQNPEDRGRLVQDEAVRILEKGAVVYLGVGPHLVDPEAAGLLRNPQAIGIQTEYWLVEVHLEQDLHIRIRGDQEAKLVVCKCSIPALKREANSINHAFTVVSEVYETGRLSHTGNVFERAYALFRPKFWRPLDDFRIRAIAESLGRQTRAAATGSVRS